MKRQTLEKLEKNPFKKLTKAQKSELEEYRKHDQSFELQNNQITKHGQKKAKKRKRNARKTRRDTLSF